jgi:hypothetical protein
MTWRKDRKDSHMCNWEHEMAIEREREIERALGGPRGGSGSWVCFIVYI